MITVLYYIMVYYLDNISNVTINKYIHLYYRYIIYTHTHTIPTLAKLNFSIYDICGDIYEFQCLILSIVLLTFVR